MNYLLIRHKVKDFKKWKAAYDAHGPARERAALKERCLHPLTPALSPSDGERESLVWDAVSQGGARASLTLGWYLLAPSSGRQFDSAEAGWNGERLLHARQAGVANQVPLQVRVEGALTAQPGESTLCLLTQMDLRKLHFAFLGRAGDFHFDFDQVGARRASGTSLGVHAAGGNQLGLGELVSGEDFQEGDEVLVRKLVGFSVEQAADVTLGEAAPPGEFALVELAALGLAMEGDAEIAHWLGDGGWLRVDGSTHWSALFFVLRVALYATFCGLQQGWWCRECPPPFPAPTCSAHAGGGDLLRWRTQGGARCSVRLPKPATIMMPQFGPTLTRFVVPWATIRPLLRSSGSALRGEVSG